MGVLSDESYQRFHEPDLHLFFCFRKAFNWSKVIKKQKERGIVESREIFDKLIGEFTVPGASILFRIFRNNAHRRSNRRHSLNTHFRLGTPLLVRCLIAIKMSFSERDAKKLQDIGDGHRIAQIQKSIPRLMILYSLDGEYFRQKMCLPHFGISNEMDHAEVRSRLHEFPKEAYGLVGIDGFTLHRTITYLLSI